MTASVRIPPALRDRVATLVARRAGIEPPGWVLEARIAARLGALGIGADDYLGACDAAELDALVECLRVGETRFFRHRAHWDALATVVVPALREVRPSGVVRGWSAGCASGEEAYTLALVLGRGLPPPGHQVQIVASDISKDALAVAQAGIYSTAAAERVPEAMRPTAFEPLGNGAVRVAAPIARSVRFVQQNLLDVAPVGDLDVVFCRNVLIYFTAAARAEAVARLVEALRPGGFLFLGYSESLRDRADLDPIDPGGAVIYQRRRAVAPTRAPRLSTPPPIRPAPPSATPAPATATPVRTTPRPTTPPTGAVLHLRGRYENAERLGSEIGALIAGATQRAVIELDGADFLGDDAARVLRRARAAADAAGVELVLVATRPGTRRWLGRWGLDREASS